MNQWKTISEEASKEFSNLAESTKMSKKKLIALIATFIGIVLMIVGIFPFLKEMLPDKDMSASLFPEKIDNFNPPLPDINDTLNFLNESDDKQENKKEDKKEDKNNLENNNNLFVNNPEGDLIDSQNPEDQLMNLLSPPSSINNTSEQKTEQKIQNQNQGNSINNKKEDKKIDFNPEVKTVKIENLHAAPNRQQNNLPLSNNLSPTLTTQQVVPTSSFRVNTHTASNNYNLTSQNKNNTLPENSNNNFKNNQILRDKLHPSSQVNSGPKTWFLILLSFIFAFYSRKKIFHSI